MNRSTVEAQQLLCEKNLNSLLIHFTNLFGRRQRALANYLWLAHFGHGSLIQEIAIVIAHAISDGITSLSGDYTTNIGWVGIGRDFACENEFDVDLRCGAIG